MLAQLSNQPFGIHCTLPQQLNVCMKSTPHRLPFTFMSQRNGELEADHLILTESSANRSQAALIFTARRQRGPYKSVGRPNFTPFTALVAVIFPNFPKFCSFSQVQRKPRTSSHSHIYSCQAELKKAQGGIQLPVVLGLQLSLRPRIASWWLMGLCRSGLSPTK
jgi:hypothetical protein